MHRIRCSEIWGGIRNVDMDLCTSGLSASLFSSSCAGGKGGDIYYFSVCGSDRLTRVAIADVVGHGEKVSAVSQWLYDALAARMNTLEGDGVLSDLNSLAAGRGLDCMTTAAVVGFYESDGNLYFSYAGHPPLLLNRRGESQWNEMTLPSPTGVGNLPLGVVEEGTFDQASSPLRSGDRMFLYTDGVIEAPDAEGNAFGLDRLLHVITANRGAPLTDLKQEVLGAVRAHAGQALSHDDMTMMALEIR